MGRFYGVKIQAGEMALEEVPRWWKAATEKWLKANT